MVAAAVAGGSIAAGVAGSAMQSSAASSAADKSSAASKQASDQQYEMYKQTRSDLQPFVQSGYSNLNDYTNYYKGAQNQLDSTWQAAQDHVPTTITADNIKNMPAYQFNLSQGLQATQNSAAAKGLGVSGSAMKAAGNYATGLANNYWKDYFNEQQGIYNDYLNQAQLKGNQLNEIYGMISAPVTLGENAAAQTGNYGTQAAQTAGGYTQNSGIAQASGTTAAANAWQSGINNAVNAASGYAASQYGNSGTGNNTSYVDNGTW